MIDKEEYYDDLRDLVARFILNSAEDPTCLFESAGELTQELLPWSEDNDAEFNALDREIVDEAYDIFGRAKVYVVIDELEYGD